MPTGDEIVAWKKAIEEQVPYKRSDCPRCAWPLEEHPGSELRPKGLHCPFCGEIING